MARNRFTSLFVATGLMTLIGNVVLWATLIAKVAKSESDSAIFGSGGGEFAIILIGLGLVMIWNGIRRRVPAQIIFVAAGLAFLGAAIVAHISIY